MKIQNDADDDNTDLDIKKLPAKVVQVPTQVGMSYLPSDKELNTPIKSNRTPRSVLAMKHITKERVITMINYNQMIKNQGWR